jgi:mannose-6-phosphate isomerase-like protein (cupin superfamily)
MMPILLSFSLSAQKQNIEIKALYSDSLSSAFEIIVRDSVGLHYHAEHTEHLFVKTGEASMQINDSTFTITQGEYYTIPTGAQHAVWVQSKTPLKVISVQCPQFLGKDRHFIENE